MTETTEQELQTYSPGESEHRSINSLILDTSAMSQLQAIAKQMSEAKWSVPEHLKGNEADCLAIAMQSMIWQLNPFIVSQKTHQVNGKLGYEAQLVNAIVMSQGFIQGSFKYEYNGEGKGLSCRVGAVLRGESDVTWGEWLSMSEVGTQNSPLWKTNPKQQLGYLQVKNWARAFVPGAILGIYTDDELADTEPMKNITPAAPPAPDRPAEPVFYTESECNANLPYWEKTYQRNSGKAEFSVDRMIKWFEAKDGKKIPDKYKEIMQKWQPIEGESRQVDDPPPQTTTEDDPEPQDVDPNTGEVLDTTAGDDFFAEADKKAAEEAKKKGGK